MTISRPRVFVSYRRGDSSPTAGRLADGLSNHFGSTNVFIDVDRIEIGVDFLEAIGAALDRCDVVLVLIGQDWLKAADSNGRRRLDNPADYVLLEIKAGLDRDIRVIPVLIDGVGMPSAEELPAAIVDLARRNAYHLTSSRWRSDLAELIERLEALRPKGDAESSTPAARKKRALTTSSNSALRRKPASRDDQVIQQPSVHGPEAIPGASEVAPAPEPPSEEASAHGYPQPSTSGGGVGSETSATLTMWYENKTITVVAIALGIGLLVAGFFVFKPGRHEVAMDSASDSLLSSAPADTAVAPQGETDRAGNTTKTGASGSQARRDSPPSPTTQDALPEFGEYVYVEVLPEAITKVNPEYPDVARDSSIAGTVVVQALIGTDGHVKDTKVVKPIPMLNDAAVRAVRQWVFKPAMSGNKPVAVWVAVPVRFSLH